MVSAPGWPGGPPANEPAYTVPPAPRPTPGTVYPSGGARPTSGAPAHQAYEAAPPSPGYGEWARGGPRPQGTVYGRTSAPPAQPQPQQHPVAHGPDQTRVAPAHPYPVPPQQFQPGSPLESSGSLTGHILSQGSWDVPPPKSRTAKVVIVIVVILIILIGGGAAAAIFAQDFVNDLFGGLVQE